MRKTSDAAALLALALTLGVAGCSDSAPQPTSATGVPPVSAPAASGVDGSGTGTAAASAVTSGSAASGSGASGGAGGAASGGGAGTSGGAAGAASGGAGGLSANDPGLRDNTTLAATSFHNLFYLALAGGSDKAFTDRFAPECAACAALARQLVDFRSKGWKAKGATSFFTPEGDYGASGDRVWIEGNVLVSEYAVVDKGGKTVRTEKESRTPYRFTFRVSGPTFTLLELTRL